MSGLIELRLTNIAVVYSVTVVVAVSKSPSRRIVARCKGSVKL